MKKLIHFFSLILVILLILPSCAKGGNDVEASSDTPLETSENTTEESSGKITEDTLDTTEETYADGLIRLSKDGSPLYRIVRSARAGEQIKSLSMALTKYLNELNGCEATFELKTDTHPISQYLEVLIGGTSHEESSSLIAELDVGGWAVKKTGGKIVVCGTTAEAMKSAIEHFKSCVSVNHEGDAVADIEPEGYIYKGSAPFFDNGQPISSFVIVSSSESLSEATQLRNKIKNAYGVELEIKDEDAPRADNEILVGNCNRSEVGEALSEVSEKTGGYIVKANGSKLIIAGHSTTSTMIAVNAVSSRCFDTELSKQPQISEGVIVKADDAFGDVSAKHLTDGAEVRIMSFNVLSELFCDISSESRKKETAGTILAYMPDVIGFQEFDGYYQSNIRPLISDDYEMILGRKNDNSVGYNGIAYNKNTLTLLDKGYVEYRKTAQGRNHKYLAYGIFRTNSSGETFALINLHWDVKDDYKMMQCEDTLALIEQLRAQYSNCPVFVTGDYNTNRHTDYFKALLSGATMQTAEVSAKTKINDEYNTYHGVPLGTLPAKKDTSIDHVVHTSNATALTYKVIIDLPTLYASDHNPVIADFTLN